MTNKLKTTRSLLQLCRNVKGPSSPWKDEPVCGCHHMINRQAKIISKYVQLIPGIMQRCLRLMVFKASLKRRLGIKAPPSALAL